jgi:hypothetical protein
VTYQSLVQQRRCTRCRRRAARRGRTKCTACAARLRVTDQAGKLRREYDLTPGELRQMRRAQKDKCFVCRRRVRRGEVDHDHRTGRTRAWVCGPCNRAEGLQAMTGVNVVRWAYGVLALRTVARW